MTKNQTHMLSYKIETFSSNPFIKYVIEDIDFQITNYCALYRFEIDILSSIVDYSTFDRKKFSDINNQLKESKYHKFNSFKEAIPLLDFYCHFLKLYDPKDGWGQVINTRYEEILVALKP